MGSSLQSLTIREARRIALTAQGFARPRPRRPTRRQIAEVIRGLGLLQIDCVNVVAPAHYQVPFSRLGPYDRAHFDEVVYRSGEFTEQWAHEASIIPVDTWPLLRHRMTLDRFERWPFARAYRQHPEYAAWVFQQVRERGPLGAAELPAPDGVERRIPGSWVGTVPRAMLEAGFTLGQMAVVERRPDFSRIFDLAERRIPEAHRSRELSREEAERELLRIAARGHGVATAKDLADYFRMKVGDALPRIRELADCGELIPAQVEGWRETAWLQRDARAARRIEAAALLSPFDPLIWTRARVSRLFEFDYRVEIFVPPAQRRWGFYVLPFLLGDRLVARVDLRVNRPARVLKVQGAWIEGGADPGETADRLAAELRTLAEWLSMDSVAVGRRGNFAKALAAAVRN